MTKTTIILTVFVIQIVYTTQVNKDRPKLSVLDEDECYKCLDQMGRCMCCCQEYYACYDP